MRPASFLPVLLTSTALCSATALGCGGSGPTPDPGVERADAASLTVAYRNRVRLPDGGRALIAEDFAKQIRRIDPGLDVHCLADESPAYRDAAAFLGGVSWAHPMAILRDSSLPPLYAGPRPENFGIGSSANAGAAPSADASPVIERPDLVGVQSGIAMFLSKQHGLLAVDARGPSPSLSCSMRLPGEPMNFLFKGNDLVVVVNARNYAHRSALVRYSFDGTRFHFVEALRFDDQRVLDARLFDSTLAVYTSWSRPKPEGTYPDPKPWAEPSGVTTGAVPSSYGGSMAGAPSADFGYGRAGGDLGTKLNVIKWDEKLEIDWQDSLLNDPAKSDPTEGVTPPASYTPGQIISEQKTFKPFVTASDRYLVIPRDKLTTRFERWETRHYQVCVSYNPRAYEVDSCNTTYERRPNPDYRPPNPATGDYSCSGKPLADCLKEAAPVVSQYINVPTGTTCQKVWRGACEKYEMRSTTYPTFSQDTETELSIYRFEAGSFVRLDGTMGTLEEKADAVAFKSSPLAVKGSIANRNQVQFQNGHLYVFSDRALQTLSVSGNSIAYLDRLPISVSTGMNPSVVFSNDRAMISAPSIHLTSDVAMLSLSVASKPALLNAFSMPGQSTQLILAEGGVLGPGQVQLGGGGNAWRNLQKLTLFSRDDGRELDNLLLGTEYDALASSWFASSDDQRIRLAPGGRLFLPYSGRHHADDHDPVAHRLSISRIEGARLVSERSFQVSEEIIRTAALDPNRSLVFANSAAYLVDHASAAPADWSLGVLRELFVPFATYRLDDGDTYARIARVGSKCRVRTHKGHASAFEREPLGEATLACGEGETPTAYKRSILFRSTMTGVEIGEDGRTITPLEREKVAAVFDALQKTKARYCWIEGGTTYAPVLTLDEVPSGVLCRSSED